MLRQLVAIILFLQLCTCELLYVAELFRHGARHTVLELYDHNDSAIDDGQLTGVGMRQHYNLGRYLRQQYIDTLNFLNKSFDHRQMEIFSTQKNRTIESALSHLYGLFPDNFGPTTNQSSNSSLLLPPYQNATSFLDSEYSLPSGGSSFPIHNADPFFNCPRQDLMVAQTLYHKSSKIGVLDLQYTPLFIRTAHAFKLKPSYEANIGVMTLLYDNLISRFYLGKTFPSQFDWSDLMNLRHLSQIMMSLAFEGDAGAAKSSLLFKKIISDMDHKLSNPSSNKKWTLLSGHDTNVLPILIFLNITNSSCLEDKWKNRNLQKYVNCEDGPDYAASLLFELYQEQERVKIKIKYNGKYVNLCDRKEDSCLYSEWKARIEAQYVNYRQLCGLQTKKVSNEFVVVDQ